MSWTSKHQGGLGMQLSGREMVSHAQDPGFSPLYHKTSGVGKAGAFENSEHVTEKERTWGREKLLKCLPAVFFREPQLPTDCDSLISRLLHAPPRNKSQLSRSPNKPWSFFGFRYQYQNCVMVSSRTHRIHIRHFRVCEEAHEIRKFYGTPCRAHLSKCLFEE